MKKEPENTFELSYESDWKLCVKILCKLVGLNIKYKRGL